MKQLSSYVARFVLGAIVLVLMVVLGIDVIAATVDGLDDIRNDYHFIDVLYHVGLTLPSRIVENIPFATLIGCLIGLGVLAGNSELVIMRAAGVSLLRITVFVVKPVILVIIVGALLGDFVVPYTDQLAESRKIVLRGEQDSLAATTGIWNREGNEFIHFNAVHPNGRLFGVTRYRFGDQRNIEEVSFAAQATFHDDHWLEERGVTTRFIHNGTETDRFETRRWESGLSPDLLQLMSMPAESLALRSLYDYARYLDTHGQKSSVYWLAFWNKALLPATVIGLVLIAVSFIFGPLREATMGYRVFSGVVVGIVFQTIQKLLGPSSIVFGFSPFWAVLVPAVISMLIGLVLLRRAA
ncbi:MAG: LPS export ABC transporter permease LptG [Gammaproteobacteria bacterium]|nr:MAG: LPS export ABC transporter permease LptG [Gammaproteobacteria bacterium]RLA53463.1 MAG: LPS export ABC transporter permease LptG [Gammaproteobacteria bacterium]